MIKILTDIPNTPIIKSRWDQIVHADTEELYEQAVAEMAEAWRKHPGCMAYLRRQWLDLYRDRFVQAWTKNILTYGTNTTNRLFLFLSTTI